MGQTPLVVTVAGVIASLVLVGVILELIRSRRLRERYALLWLLTGLVLLHYSTVISKLADQNVILAQRVALLESRLDESVTRPPREP